MMSKHRNPKTIMRYDHGRENMELSAVNFLGYEEEVEFGNLHIDGGCNFRKEPARERYTALARDAVALRNIYRNRKYTKLLTTT